MLNWSVSQLWSRSQVTSFWHTGWRPGSFESLPPWYFPCLDAMKATTGNVMGAVLFKKIRLDAQWNIFCTWHSQDSSQRILSASCALVSLADLRKEGQCPWGTWSPPSQWSTWPAMKPRNSINYQFIIHYAQSHFKKAKVFTNWICICPLNLLGLELLVGGYPTIATRFGHLTFSPWASDTSTISLAQQQTI